MIKQLFNCIGEYKKESLLAPLAVTGEVVLEVLIPLIMADLIDKGIMLGRMDVILKLGGILVVAVLFSLTLGVLAGLYASRASAGLPQIYGRECTIRYRIFLL